MEGALNLAETTALNIFPYPTPDLPQPNSCPNLPSNVSLCRPEYVNNLSDSELLSVVHGLLGLIPMEVFCRKFSCQWPTWSARIVAGKLSNNMLVSLPCIFPINFFPHFYLNFTQVFLSLRNKCSFMHVKICIKLIF